MCAQRQAGIFLPKNLFVANVALLEAYFNSFAET